MNSSAAVSQNNLQLCRLKGCQPGEVVPFANPPIEATENPAEGWNPVAAISGVVAAECKESCWYWYISLGSIPPPKPVGGGEDEAIEGSADDEGVSILIPPGLDDFRSVGGCWSTG